MIIVRSPLRVTLGGGGTDLPSYYEEHEGFLVAAAIDKYVYVTINRPFKEGIYLKYSQYEQVGTVEAALARSSLYLNREPRNDPLLRNLDLKRAELHNLNTRKKRKKTSRQYLSTPDIREGPVKTLLP